MSKYVKLVITIVILMLITGCDNFGELSENNENETSDVGRDVFNISLVSRIEGKNIGGIKVIKNVYFDDPEENNELKFLVIDGVEIEPYEFLGYFNDKSAYSFELITKNSYMDNHKVTKMIYLDDKGELVEKTVDESFEYNIYFKTEEIPDYTTTELRVYNYYFHVFLPKVPCSEIVTSDTLCDIELEDSLIGIQFNVINDLPEMREANKAVVEFERDFIYSDGSVDRVLSNMHLVYVDDVWLIDMVEEISKSNMSTEDIDLRLPTLILDEYEKDYIYNDIFESTDCDAISYEDVVLGCGVIESKSYKYHTYKDQTVWYHTFDKTNEAISFKKQSLHISYPEIFGENSHYNMDGVNIMFKTVTIKKSLNPFSKWDYYLEIDVVLTNATPFKKVLDANKIHLRSTYVLDTPYPQAEFGYNEYDFILLSGDHVYSKIYIRFDAYDTFDRTKEIYLIINNDKLILDNDMITDER